MPPAPPVNIGHTDVWQLLATAGVLLGIDVVLYSLRGRFSGLKDVEQGGSGNTGAEFGSSDESRG